MEDKMFVVAIGGTGMRCLESFVHLCAIGMFDNHEIDILTLDTDEVNGNKKRVEDLVDHYVRIKSTPNELGGKPTNNNFFSAKLKQTKFWTNYTPGRDSFQVLSKINAAGDESRDLSGLFFDRSVQVFNLAHGYRAQTHLGSHMMYHGIIEAAINCKKGVGKPHEKEFMDYLDRIFKAGKNARVFIFGSIFGGTGASSIPVVPRAFSDAMKYFKDQPIELSAKFSASLLTEYFSFTSPNDAQKKDEKNAVIADSTFFTLNSQAALQFYQSDPTVRKTYKYLYHVGWPVDAIDFSKGKNESETITGGEKQLNPCHIAELICAFGAYDFFNRVDSFDQEEAQYMFRTADFENNTFHFDFPDLCDDVNKFKNRLAGFYSIALFTLVYHKGIQYNQEGMTGWISRMEKQNYSQYSNKLEASQLKDISDYFKKFLFELDVNGNLKEGWLYQIRKSFNGKFLFPETSFGGDLPAIESINPGVILPDEKSQWGMGKGGFLGGKPTPKDVSETFDEFISAFIKVENFPKEDQLAYSALTELMAQLYNTISQKQAVA
jgi:hypothetical protein|uniref:hypothetical protein n=1 Tax=Flavobacterium sp. TaxID=239 RepID=UPI004049ADD3